MHPSSKVIKINVTWPFCVEHHIDIHPNASIAFVKIDIGKKFITSKLPPLCMVIENECNHQRIGNGIFNFPVTKLGNWKVSITNFWSTWLAIENFQFVQKNLGVAWNFFVIKWPLIQQLNFFLSLPKKI
jgi:hypothetical protein